MQLCVYPCCTGAKMGGSAPRGVRVSKRLGFLHDVCGPAAPCPARHAPPQARHARSIEPPTRCTASLGTIVHTPCTAPTFPDARRQDQAPRAARRPSRQAPRRAPASTHCQPAHHSSAYTHWTSNHSKQVRNARLRWGGSCAQRTLPAGRPRTSCARPEAWISLSPHAWQSGGPSALSGDVHIYELICGSPALGPQRPNGVPSTAGQTHAP